MVEDMLSADDVSCSSSQVSAKSEKNMADFDGEESGCEEELVQINSHAELSSHLQQHLPNLASIYHEHLVQGEPHSNPWKVCNQYNRLFFLQLLCYITRQRTREANFVSALISAGPAVHKHQYSSSHAVTDINLDNVCKKGNTLLWDLVQDEDAVWLQTQLFNFSLWTVFSMSHVFR